LVKINYYIYSNLCSALIPYFKKQKNRASWALVAHACNPSYTRERDQEDHGSRLTQAKKKKCNTVSQKYPTHRKIRLQSGSSGTAPA
jgi:hypothetical protein